MRSRQSRALRVAAAAAFNELVSNATQTFDVAFAAAAGAEARGTREGSDLRVFPFVRPNFALASYPQPVGTLRGYVERGHPLPRTFEGGAHDGMHFIFTLSAKAPAETRVGQWGQTVIGTYRVSVRQKSPTAVLSAVPAPAQASAVIAVLKAAGAKSYPYSKLPAHARESLYPRPEPDSRWVYAEVGAAALYRLVGGRDGHPNFAAYHTAWLKKHKPMAKPEWAVVLDSVGNKTISDGWEEFHTWVSQGARKIPCVAPLPPKAGTAAASKRGAKGPPPPPPPPGPKSVPVPGPARRPTPVKAPSPKTPVDRAPRPAPAKAPTPALAPKAAIPQLPEESTCAIQSIAFGLGITPEAVWEKSHDLWADGGRAKAGMTARDIWRVLQRLGKGARTRADLFEKAGGRGTSSFKNVLLRLAKLPGPAFLVSVDQHVVCVKNGKLKDTWHTPAGSHVRGVTEIVDDASESPLNNRRVEDLTGRFVLFHDDRGRPRRGVYLSKGTVFAENADHPGIYELVKGVEGATDSGKSVPARLQAALKRAFRGKDPSAPSLLQVGDWAQGIFVTPSAEHPLAGIYVGGDRVIVDLGPGAGDKRVGVITLKDVKKVRGGGKPASGQKRFYEQMLANSRKPQETKAAVPVPPHMRDPQRTALGPAKYAKGKVAEWVAGSGGKKKVKSALAAFCGRAL